MLASITRWGRIRHMAFDLRFNLVCGRYGLDAMSITFCFLQATHAVIFRLMSGGFLSPKDSRITSAGGGRTKSSAIIRECKIGVTPMIKSG